MTKIQVSDDLLFIHLFINFIKLKRYTYILLLAFTISKSAAYAQQLLFNNISDQLGLPAQESYNVMQDSKGFIWISTEGGLCKYNGSYSRIFDKKNGLSENACYSVAEDSNGKIWMLTSANRILCYEKGSIKEASFSKSLVKQLKGSLQQGYSLALINDSIIISTQGTTHAGSVSASNLTVMKRGIDCWYYFIKKGNNLVAVKKNPTPELQKMLITAGFMTIKINTGNSIKKVNIPYTSKDQPSWRVLTASNSKGEHFIAFGNILVKINSDFSYKVYELPNELLTVYCDKDNGLWTGSLKGGICYYADTKQMDTKIVNLGDFSVSGICVDNENGVWCTTIERGVFYCHNKNVINYANIPGLNKAAELLKYAGGKILVSASNNELFELGKNNFKQYRLKLPGNKSISDILQTKDGWALSGIGVILKTNNSFNAPVYIKNKGHNFYAGAKQLTYSPGSRLFGLNYGDVFEIIDDVAFSRTTLTSGGRCLLCLNDTFLLYACKDGLFTLSISACDGKTYVSKKISGIDGSITKLFKSKDDIIWITTKESGLYIYRDGSIINMTGKTKLPTERLYDITEDKQGFIWLGSNLGLILLKPVIDQEKNITSCAIKIYNTLNGLPSNEIYKVAADSDFIYVSGREGISKFSQTITLSNTLSPSIYLNTIKVNDVTIDANKPIQLSYKDNSLKIDFDVLSYKTINDIKLVYKLRGLAEKSFKIEKVSGSVVLLDNLPPNGYELSVYALNNDNVMSLAPVVLHFEIGKPLWQHAWFIIFCIAILAGIIYVIIKLIIQNIRKKAEDKNRISKQLAEFQLTALQAQMNPHFIFNAINSIQNYILKKKEQEAYNYLAKFSKLIRMVLNNSEQKTISLHEELETIKLYVELEQLRFKNSFDFEVCIAKNLNIYELQVPTMLIQPYLENAIWHGLMNLDSHIGKLNIDFSQQEGLLKITIEDNGIGREQSEKYRTESIHKPVAMKLTEKRLFTINSMQDYIGAKVIISDLHSEDGKAAGTRVEIFLPIQQI